MLYNRESKFNFAAGAGAALALALLAPIPATADCFDDAARYHNVNPWILRAIATQESRFNPTAIHPVNRDGTRYHGMTGITVHLPELADTGSLLATYVTVANLFSWQAGT